MKNSYKNPWHKETNVPRNPIYENNAPMVFEYRGVSVFKLNDRSFDYVLNGCAITQRAGFKPASAPAIIDEILSGETPVSDGVAEHLKACGFAPLTYEQYTADWQAGKRA